MTWIKRSGMTWEFSKWDTTPTLGKIDLKISSANEKTRITSSSEAQNIPCPQFTSGKKGCKLLSQLGTEQDQQLKLGNPGTLHWTPHDHHSNATSIGSLPILLWYIHVVYMHRCLIILYVLLGACWEWAPNLVFNQNN